MRAMQVQMEAMTREIQRLSAENARLTMEQQQGLVQQQAQTTQALQAMAEALQSQRPNNKWPSLVDNKGLGKPSVFNNKQADFLRWSRNVENFAVSNFGEEFRVVMEWAATSEVPIEDDMVKEEFGSEADASDQVEEIDYKLSQLYLALVSLTEDESQDIVVGAGPGRGAESWRKLFKRWDPVVAGRRRALLRQIISPERCKLEELVGCWERWEQLVRRYEKQKDSEGQKQVVARDVKMTSFEMMVPSDIENHLILNRSRINTYELQCKEVQDILDAQIGGKIKEFQIKCSRPRSSEDAMEVDAFSKGGYKGTWWDKGGKGGSGGKQSGKAGGASAGGAKTGGGKGYSSYFEGYCGNCEKWGHKAVDCWSKPQQQQQQQHNRPQASPKGYPSKGTFPTKGKGKGFSGNGPGGSGGKAGCKGKGKGKGKFMKGKPGMGSMDESGQELSQWCEQWDDSQWQCEQQWSEQWGQGPCNEPAAWSGQQADWAPGFEIKSFDLGSFDGVLDLAVFDGQGQWIKMNYDTGAAQTAFPRAIASEFSEKPVVGNGQCYRSATGELIEDEGGLKVTAETERGDMARVSGRVASVHKPLVSAAKSAGFGQNGWITKHGGWLIPDNSAISHKIKKLLDKEAAKQNHSMIPLYEELGVYNFYLKVGGRGSKVEPIIGEFSSSSFAKPVNGVQEQKILSETRHNERVAPGFSRQP